MANRLSTLAAEVVPNLLPALPPRNEETLMAEEGKTRPLSRGMTDNAYPNASHSTPAAPSHPAAQLSSVQHDVLTARLATAERDLDKERQAHKQTILDLRQKEQTALDLRQNWRETVNELNRYLRLGQGQSQMTDDDLLQYVNRLRQDTTAFSAQYFGDELGDPRFTKARYGLFKEHMSISQTEYEAYMRSASLRANLIQSFLWAFFYHEIFGKFCWMTTRSGASVYRIWKSFDSLYEESKDFIPDARQKCSMWRANTCNLMIDSMDLQGPQVHDDQQEWVERLVETVSKRLYPFSLSKPAKIRDGLEVLFKLSIDLDQAINRQVAMLTWDFGAQLPSRFDPACMALEGGSKPNGEELVARLVLAPGLLKRGRASGDKFDGIIRLLDTVVSCELPLCSVANDISRGGTSLKQKVRQTWYG
ncbi:unnamed protein product [Penicillium glandicola]